MKNLLVKDWMTAALMRQKNIRRLPIVDSDGKLVGIISQTDVMAAKPSDATTLDIWEINYLLSRLKVEKVMTPQPYTVRPNSTLKDAAQLMYEHKIGGIPVVDEHNVVVGIITESDIFRVLIAWFNEETAG